MDFDWCIAEVKADWFGGVGVQIYIKAYVNKKTLVIYF
jgi:hypothetical protein